MADQLSSMLIANPWLFDPSQQSNPYSPYSGAVPWPPSYNPGLAGGPVNAATGRPIQSYQNWAAQNPQQPAAQGTTLNTGPSQYAGSQALLSMLGITPQMYANSAATPDQIAAMALGGGAGLGAQLNSPSMLTAFGINPWGSTPGTTQGAPQAQPAQSGAPNNWYPALNALANPGNPVTPGATVPMQQGYQPAGGINQAFLQARGMGPGATGGPGGAPMGGGASPINQNFMNVLQALQNRPQ